MVEIYLKNNVFYELETTIEHVRNLLEDEVIKDETFLAFQCEDGARVYIKKGEIVSFNETEKRINAG